MLTTIIAIRPVPRRRSGRHRALSLSQPKPADAIVATTIATATVTLVPAMVMLARQRVHEVGRERAEGDQLTVREVGQARRPEDHRQAERRHRQQQREHQAADGELQCLDPGPGLGGAGVADREGHEDVGAELRGDLERDLLRVAQRGALRQRRLVDLDREGVAEVVDRRARAAAMSKTPVASLVPLPTTLPAGVLDGDLHVRHRRPPASRAGRAGSPGCGWCRRCGAAASRRSASRPVAAGPPRPSRSLPSAAPSRRRRAA